MAITTAERRRATTRAPTLLPAGRWEVDPERSSVGFRVRHLAVATVEGRFGRFGGTIETREDGGGGATGHVEVGSVDTGIAIRDARLAGELFRADEHPLAAFRCLSVTPHGGNAWTMTGALTIRGATREITLRVEVADAGPDRARLRARGTISRRALGLEWSALVDGGRLLVSDRVDLRLDLVLAREREH